MLNSCGLNTERKNFIEKKDEYAICSATFGNQKKEEIILIKIIGDRELKKYAFPISNHNRSLRNNF